MQFAFAILALRGLCTTRRSDKSRVHCFENSNLCNGLIKWWISARAGIPARPRAKISLRLHGEFQPGFRHNFPSPPFCFLEWFHHLSSTVDDWPPLLLRILIDGTYFYLLNISRGYMLEVLRRGEITPLSCRVITCPHVQEILKMFKWHADPLLQGSLKNSRRN